MQAEQGELAAPSTKIGLWFINLGLVALTFSLMVGVLAAFKYLFPDFLDFLPFYKLRPMHVSLAISWIFLVAIGGIYYYLPNYCKLPLWSPRAARLHFWVFLLTGLAILGAYLMGYFGGREYWEFPPVLALPIFASWILFGVNFYRTLARHQGSWPVYFWMWATGIIFFFFTFAESYLWIFPYFRESIIRELTVQWKSYGALIGSWNMLVYGTAIFVMAKIGGDDRVARSKMAFSLYFLSLVALMFGWAHHAYAVPFAPWVRNLAYIVSMSELLILGKIIWDWRATLKSYQKHNHCQAYRFLFAADIWIFLNLILAIMLSVPAINIFTHGTHITVAHAMGTTIGINSMILLASVFFVIESKFDPDYCASREGRVVAFGSRLANISLFVFLGALLGAGLMEAPVGAQPFYASTEAARPYLMAFAVAGGGLMLGLWMVLLPAIKIIWRGKAG